MILHLIVLAAVLTVLVTLILGVLNMRKDGQEAREYANKLMRWRVGAQFTAFAVMVLVIYLKKQAGA